MTEEQKAETSAPAGYYKDRGTKIKDFFIGFLGYPALMTVLPALSALRGDSGAVLGGLYTVLVSVGFLVYSYQTGRKYIAIGLLSLIIVPLLIMGSCLLIMVAVK